jgi:hypothetical protein
MRPVREPGEQVKKFRIVLEGLRGEDTSSNSAAAKRSYKPSMCRIETRLTNWTCIVAPQRRLTNCSLRGNNVAYLR